MIEVLKPGSLVVSLFFHAQELGLAVQEKAAHIFEIIFGHLPYLASCDAFLWRTDRVVKMLSLDSFNASSSFATSLYAAKYCIFYLSDLLLLSDLV